MTKTTKCAVVAAALALGAACGKGGGGDAATEDAGATPPAPSGATTPATGEVATYPDTIPQGGTKITRITFAVHQAADENSPTLTRIGPGTAINLKGSHSSWMLIEWPSGVGTMSPGWINLDLHDTTKVSDATPDAGVDAGKDAGVDAGKDAGVDAGKTDAGTRPTIKIKPPKPG